MATHIHQSAKARAGARVRITSNYKNKKLSLRIPRGMRVRLKQV